MDNLTEEDIAFSFKFPVRGCIKLFIIRTYAQTDNFGVYRGSALPKNELTEQIIF